MRPADILRKGIPKAIGQANETRTNFGKRDFLNEKQVVSARTAKSELNEKDSLLAAQSRRFYKTT